MIQRLNSPSHSQQRILKVTGTYHVNFLYRTKGNNCDVHGYVQRWPCIKRNLEIYQLTKRNTEKQTDRANNRLSDRDKGWDIVFSHYLHKNDNTYK